MLFSSSFPSAFPTREEKFCLAASRATASASSMVSLTFFFVFFFVFSFSRALRNAYPMTPEPQQKSMTRFVLSLQIPFFNLGEEDREDFSGSSSRIESKRNEVMMSSPPLAKNPGYVVHSFASTTLEPPPPPKKSFTFESTFLNDSREAFFSSPLERTLAVNANAKSFSLFLASSESSECFMVACPGTRRGCSYKSCLYFFRFSKKEKKC